MNTSTRTLQPGTVIDNRYEVVRPLGRGGFASVYLAHHLQLDRDVALKVLDPITSGSTDNFIKRFMSEARIVANIRHPNVVMIYDFGVVRDDQPYLAMEFLDGHDLDAELKNNGPMSPVRARKLFLGALDALQEGHLQKVVHKDLKPSNLYLVDPGKPTEKLMVLDYGIARVADSDSPRLTKTGGYTGTPAYMPPEYIQHSIVAPTNDVYQIALIIAESLTGKQVVNAKTSVAYMVAHLGGEHAIDPWLNDSQWGHVLRHALEVDHTKRYQDAGELRRAFAAATLPSGSAEINPVVETLFDQPSISSAMLGAPSSDPSIANQTGPVAGQVPGVAERVENRVANLHHVESTPSNPPTALIAAKQEPQPAPRLPQGHNQGYAHYPKPKKRRWPWVLLFLFLFGCFAAVATPVIIIYGYYGGWDNYVESIEAYIGNQVDEAMPNDLPEFSNFDNLDPIKMATQMLPNSTERKLQSFLQARYMIFHTIHQFSMFEVSAMNAGYGDPSGLILPAGTNTMMEVGIQFLETAQALEGGPSGLDAATQALIEDAAQFSFALEDIVDYYDVSEDYKSDGSRGGKRLAAKAKKSRRHLNQSFGVFNEKVELFYTNHFKACRKRTNDTDQVVFHACTLMLAAQDLSIASLQSHKKTEEIRFKKALVAYTKHIKTYDKSLRERFPYNAHTNFRNSARDMLKSSREWRDRSEYPVAPGKRPIPQAPVFVFSNRNFMMQSYVQMLQNYN